jgi:ribulose-phosphate 3-epimerase
MIKIAPSLLSADFSRLGEDIARVEAAGADLFHIDVMDGHFVPNISIGPVVVQGIRKATRKLLDTHLMISDPLKYLPEFVKAGSDLITMHIETVSPEEFLRAAAELKKGKIGVGVSLNPATPLKMLAPVLDAVDLVLVMSVNPGFGGQQFMPEALPKVRELAKSFQGEISVDGGVNDKTAGALKEAGATILVSGSYIFGAKDAREAIERIR